jgi:hypothetical protein
LGYPAALVYGRILPAVALSLVVGAHLFSASQEGGSIVPLVVRSQREE